jgi:hypothetical protein
MIDYTARIARLMHDIVARVPALSFIDLRRTIVFAREGRAFTDGPFATCHAVNQPPSHPTHYWWRDRRGRMVRRSEWFVVKSPVVSINGERVDYLISIVLPRFCDQTLARSHKQTLYPRRLSGDPMLAKLDTIVHELYHIDPDQSGIRKLERADGGRSAHAHAPAFYRAVAAMVRQYLDSGPDREMVDFLRDGSRELVASYGEVRATTFDTFPSFPHQYFEPLVQQPLPLECEQSVEIVSLEGPTRPRQYTERNLLSRRFLPKGIGSRPGPYRVLTATGSASMTRLAPR